MVVNRISEASTKYGYLWICMDWLVGSALRISLGTLEWRGEFEP